MSNAGPPQGAMAPLGGSDSRSGGAWEQQFNAVPPEGAIAPLGGSDLCSVKAQRQFPAGPPQGKLAPTGGSDPHSGGAWGQDFAAGPPQGEMRPPRGAATRAAVERGGKITRRPVHGVLLLDKPLGWSSNDALQKAKWLLRATKAGHTGTLDPLATGVLPLCFGAATKFSQLQLEADKTYEATVRLGQKTRTGDAEGDVIEERADAARAVTQRDVDRVRQQFTGPIVQVPPMYSALKKDGKPLYEYARAGVEVAREARAVTIYELNMALALVGSVYKAIKLIVKCSKGTYIRTLGEDVGEALGCGAHLSALRRTETGGFNVSQCVTLAALEAMTDEERLACLRPVDCLLADHAVVTLDADNAGRFLSGLRRRGDWPDADSVAVYGPLPIAASAASAASAAGAVVGAGDSTRALLGTAHVKAGELIPGRLLSPLEIEQSRQQQQEQISTI